MIMTQTTCNDFVKSSFDNNGRNNVANSFIINSSTEPNYRPRLLSSNQDNFSLQQNQSNKKGKKVRNLLKFRKITNQIQIKLTFQNRM